MKVNFKDGYTDVKLGTIMCGETFRIGDEVYLKVYSDTHPHVCLKSGMVFKYSKDTTVRRINLELTEV